MFESSAFHPDILKKQIFEIITDQDFNETALDVFRFQFQNNEVYRRYAGLINIAPDAVKHYSEIPFLPVELFKSQAVVSSAGTPARIFKSSGTTGQIQSSHYVFDEILYQKSIAACFKIFFGEIRDYTILGLVPDVKTRPESSLAYMTDMLISISENEESGIFLGNEAVLEQKINELSEQKKKVMLIGLSYALLDMAEKFPVRAPELIVVETGGMKGRREELIREQLHERLCAGFGVSKIYSEYSMSELLSQAWSKGNGIFNVPPWMKVLTRDAADPFTLLNAGERGGINIIDLANIYSCSFLSVQDTGTVHDDGSFEIAGRFDNSDLRGCSLLLS
ncbi:MAG: acyl transferase [Bacteroidota bacterium]